MKLFTLLLSHKSYKINYPKLISFIIFIFKSDHVMTCYIRGVGSLINIVNLVLFKLIYDFFLHSKNTERSQRNDFNVNFDSGNSCQAIYMVILFENHSRYKLMNVSFQCLNNNLWLLVMTFICSSTEILKIS
ncbi:unnamed protein product [Chironomus riparius]|uniref:Uncharacterized protein n=1 Tax=Chironomus riparius TaxID=315576 RepID=A0A9N9WPC3_9DIPT|nr:unnamed protein product [Chironomus riparius]